MPVTVFSFAGDNGKTIASISFLPDTMFNEPLLFFLEAQATTSSVLHLFRRC